jgi:putative transposase
MKKSRFTESRNIGILKDLKAGEKARTLYRNHGISEVTLYNWRSKYGVFKSALCAYSGTLKTRLAD